VSLSVGVLSILFAALIGSLLGLLAGYSGGVSDMTVMRACDGLLAMPPLILAVGIAAALGAGLQNITIAIAVVSVPAFVRLIRARVLSMREEEFITAATVLGASPWRIVVRHILPNSLTPAIVLISLRVSSAIVTEASLSFLGLGAKPPTPSWGAMINLGSRYLENAPWAAFSAGFAILITVIAFNLLGDGMIDLLDPRQRRVG
jgi:peptide/nickel transport system permease protein